MNAIKNWRVAGSYYETCNCNAVCPCRRLNGNPGKTSSFQQCQFLLSWKVDKGFADEIDLDGLKLAMAGFYDNAVAKSPWTIALYIDRQVTSAQFDALAAIFLGKCGGTIFFAKNIADIIAVRRAELSLNHSKDGEWISVRDFAAAAVERRADYEGTVTCSIPGHEHFGVESVSRSSVNDGPLAWTYEGRCGFATEFDYHS
jgi:hypothetical protein